MIVKVVISKVTLAPTLSFVLSNLLFTPTTYLGPLDDFTIKCSSFNYLNTSPIIYPTDYPDFIYSSVFATYALFPYNYYLFVFTFASSSL